MYNYATVQSTHFDDSLNNEIKYMEFVLQV